MDDRLLCLGSQKTKVLIILEIGGGHSMPKIQRYTLLHNRVISGLLI